MGPELFLNSQSTNTLLRSPSLFPSLLREKSLLRNMLPNPTPLRFPNPMPFRNPTRSTPSTKLSRPPSLTNTMLPSTNPLPLPPTLLPLPLLSELTHMEPSLPQLLELTHMELLLPLPSHMPDGLLLLLPKLNNFVQ